MKIGDKHYRTIWQHPEDPLVVRIIDQQKLPFRFEIIDHLKALAAYDNRVPFYAALPSSTFDWTMRDGIREIPIEERDAAEVHTIEGFDANGHVVDVRIVPSHSPVVNYGFDVTPARLVTGLITERGICAAHEDSILALFPERKTHR